MADKRRESKRRRFDVFKRDRFTCQYCGQNPPAVVLEIDHVIPLSDGGEDTIENFITACYDCNRGKAARPLDLTAIPLNYEKLAEERADRSEQIRAYREALEEYRIEIERAIDFIGASFFEPGQTFSQSSGCRHRVEKFIELLGIGEVDDAARISKSKLINRSYNQQFSYFCGICWRKCTDKGIRVDGKES